MEQFKPLNVAIVGGGPGCKAIMDMIFSERLSQLRMKLLGVACTNPGAVGYRYAQENGIYTTMDHNDLYELGDLNMIIELTGREEVANEISRTKPDHVRLMDHVAARVFWDVFKIEEESIAERKRSEDSLRESEEKYSTLVENSLTGIYIIDQDGKIAFANNKFAEIYGCSREELMGMESRRLVHPEDRAWTNHIRTKRLKGEEAPSEYEARCLTKDGETIWMKRRNTRIEYNGRPAILGNIVDITERKRTEEALEETIRRLQVAHDQALIYAEELKEEIIERKRAEEALAAERERLDVTLRSIGDGVIATDSEGRIVLLNKVAEELTGWTHEEAAGNPLEDVFHIINETTRKRCEHPVEKVIKNGKIVGLANHTVLIARDGTERILADSAAPIHGKNGEIIGVVLVFRDITEQRKIGTQLQQAQKMEAIGTLAGGIAHDFNNLLMGIQGHTSLVLLHTDSSHPHYKHINGIDDMVRRGAELTKQLLGFARGGKYVVKLTDLNHLIENSSEMFGRTKKEIRIHRKYEREIRLVEVDQGQIEQMLLNLYVNAWQAMPHGGDLYIQTSNVVLDENYTKPFSVKRGNYVKISVTDTGVGMDEATRRRVFEPFFTTKEMSKGTGLGLASAYGIVKNHGGIVNVYSEKGKGATFNIYLPASEKGVTIEEKKRADEFLLKGTETILLVDDEHMVLEVGKGMLKEMGYKVLLARSGKEAIDAYGKHKDEIDLVILDMIMPEISGGGTYDKLKEISPEIKVLLSTGYSIDGEATEIMERGCNGFIQKPFSVLELSGRIREILDKK